MDLVCVYKRDGLDMAEGDTLRIAITIIAFDCDPLLRIKEGLAKGAGDDARPASDAEILIDDDTVILLRFSVACLGRTDLDTVSLFTMVAGHGKVESHLLPFDHFDSGAARIACSGMKDRADQLTLAAPRTFFMIHYQHFLIHLKLH